MPSVIEVNVASSALADQLFKLGVPLLAQGVVINGTRCFVFGVRPQDIAAARKVLKNAFKG